LNSAGGYRSEKDACGEMRHPSNMPLSGTGANEIRLIALNSACHSAGSVGRMKCDQAMPTSALSSLLHNDNIGAMLKELRHIRSGLRSTGKCI